jgi:hypothetical protein
MNKDGSRSLSQMARIKETRICRYKSNSRKEWKVCWERGDGRQIMNRGKKSRSSVIGIADEY